MIHVRATIAHSTEDGGCAPQRDGCTQTTTRESRLDAEAGGSNNGQKQDPKPENLIWFAHKRVWNDKDEARLKQEGLAVAMRQNTRR
eukprot:scaffold21762_cov113-Isochrysis_galbana.AAC.3